MTEPTMLKSALSYARRGYRVIPLYEPFCGACTCGHTDCGSPAKHPRSVNGVSDATADERQISDWWTRWPESNIGLRCGDNFFALDVDPKNGGNESLFKLESDHGTLPATARQTTGGGGEHRLFAINGTPINTRIGLLPGIDIKSANGYIVAAPSRHISGKLYQWDESAPETLAQPPDWLVRLINAHSGTRKERFDTAGALAGAPEGKRDKTCFKLACKLRNADVPFDAAMKLVLEAAAECQPEFPADQARAKVENAYRRYEPGAADAERPALTVDDFYAYMPMHSYMFVPARALWPTASVNARVPPIANSKGKRLKASLWLDKNRSVEQMTWAPGEPLVIQHRLISDGGWINRPDCTCFNLYRPPQITAGNPAEASRWINHVRHVYGPDADHIIMWLAQRVQKPQEKINHALVLGGLQGIGKDTILEPVKHAVGAWNFHEVSPTHLLGRFNGFIKSVILRINEARDLGDVDRYGFYDHLKMYTAAPPDVLRCDEKNIREYSVLNVCGVVITTNHKTNGIYLPADDRRHYVAWSERTKEDFSADYWNSLYGWYGNGGNEHVAAYLRGLDISAFDPKAPPPKTAAFWAIVDANRAPEDAELSDVLDLLGNPKAITLEKIASICLPSFADWLRDRRNSRQIPYRIESVGYVRVRSSTAEDGLWKIGGKRQAIYARQELSLRDQIAAAIELTR
jgi:hypothetical protein